MGIYSDKLRIVAIGGGEIRGMETLGIDKRIVELTGKRSPRALFIPTASHDSERYIDAFNNVYHKKLGCRTNCLALSKGPLRLRDISERVFDADLIYVGGGNTLHMLKIWRKLGLDGLLWKAAEKGTVLSGLSAGAICWFKYGHSDSRANPSRHHWQYIRVKGLGFIDAIFCPHYHIERREKPLAQMVEKFGGIAVACDNHTGIEIVGHHYRIVTSVKNAQSWKVFKYRGKIIQERLEANLKYQDIGLLLKKIPAMV